MNGPVVFGPLSTIAAATGFLVTDPPPAHADAVAYLVNVTICDRARAGERYAQVMTGVKKDFGTSDEYQASHLIGRAVGELCPAQIWQLRQSAAGHVLTAGS